MWGVLLGFLKGPLGRAFDLAEKRLKNQNDREKLKADLIAEHMRTRPGFMQAGGFVLMLLFAAPLAFWFAAVCVYSVFWCADCAFPQTWTIAALPPPLDQWSAQIVIAIFGVAGLTRFARR